MSKKGEELNRLGAAEEIFGTNQQLYKRGDEKQRTIVVLYPIIQCIHPCNYAIHFSLLDVELVFWAACARGK